MSSRKKKNNAPSSSSSSPPPPPQSGRRPTNGGGQNNHGGGGGGGGRSRHRRSYADDKDTRGGSRFSEQTIVLCVFNGSSTGWRTLPITFRPGRTSDQELWTDIRREYRDNLEFLWRRLLEFKKVKAIVPIEFTRNDVPKRQDPKNVPGVHEFMHAYHHPSRLRTYHEWVDWFVKFKQRVGPDQTIGLEFVEGIWAEKLAAVAIFLTIGIIVASIVWTVYGGGLQTVFTVMGFVLSGVAAEVALVALYYQITLPG